MRKVPSAAGALTLTATLLLACAHDTPSAPQASARPSRLSNVEETSGAEPEPQVPHSCFGAEIRLYLPTTGLYPAAVLRQPEFGAERPPPEGQDAGGQLSAVGPGAERSGAEAARAVERAIEDAIRDIKCGYRYDMGAFRWLVICAERDGCATTIEKGQAIAAQISAIVAPAVTVDLDTCGCRAY